MIGTFQTIAAIARTTIVVLGLLTASVGGSVGGWVGVANADFAAGVNARDLEHDGLTRIYDVYAPASYDGTKPTSLVLDFHGFSSPKEGQASLSGFRELADQEGFLVAWGQGTGGDLAWSWNGGSCCGAGVRDQVDDVGFVRAMIQAIAAEGSVDTRRVYATGLSNGGAMTHRLACEAADVIAAAAPMAFGLPFSEPSNCQPSRPITLFSVMGLTDTVVSYAGGFTPGAVETFDFWRDHNGCDEGDPDVVETTGMATCEIYTRCDATTQTALCSIVADDFANVPPLQQFAGHLLYLNDDLDLAQEAWSVMRLHALPLPEPSAALLQLCAITGVFALARRRRYCSGARSIR